MRVRARTRGRAKCMHACTCEGDRSVVMSYRENERSEDATKRSGAVRFDSLIEILCLFVLLLYPISQKVVGELK